MLNNLFINITIILSFIFIGGQFFKNISYHRPLSLKIKVIIGVSTGFLGFLLMKFGFRIEEDLLDLRYLAVMLATIVGGPVASILSSVIICIARLLLTDYSTSMQLAIYTTLFIGIGNAFVSVFFTGFSKKWFFLHVYMLTIVSVPIYYIFHSIFVLELYLLVSSIAAYITFFSLNYVLQSNELFRMMKHYAMIDSLTELGNNRSFDIELKRHIEDTTINENSLCLLLVDIDYFKCVNDTYGHPAGDEVLKQIGALLKKHSPSPDLVFRKGGEEFAMLLPGATLQHAIEIGENIRTAVEQQVFHLSNGAVLNITVSIGASIYETLPQQFIQLADNALYTSKHNGRNKVSANISR
ncbi:GGDEF domain-containing protein (plasmid) [Bacillus thuringiensis LM1212]|uniref:GGDEF domain-containing protein n=1 Tax=Bacillus cereus group TaxID=86661 RepID=UPI0004234BBB|nr:MULTISPECIES: diguanylate cyclase [Bacillus cereus group]AXY11201.1 GGDEF domain-containing protein [Bacillus thuringiensis LM1212]QDF27416.1 diguanylate cyclase [Bacillus tropicus]QUG99096.1 diguanylate cyclase [Bacillus tropicus]